MSLLCGIGRWLTTNQGYSHSLPFMWIQHAPQSLVWTARTGLPSGPAFGSMCAIGLPAWLTRFGLSECPVRATIPLALLGLNALSKPKNKHKSPHTTRMRMCLAWATMCRAAWVCFRTISSSFDRLPRASRLGVGAHIHSQWFNIQQASRFSIFPFILCLVILVLPKKRQLYVVDFNITSWLSSNLCLSHVHIVAVVLASQLNTFSLLLSNVVMGRSWSFCPSGGNLIASKDMC